MTPAWIIWAVTGLLVAQGAAQSSTADPLGIIISEAYSIYTEVTSLIGSAASAATATQSDSLSSTTSASSSSRTSNRSSAASSSASSARAAASSFLKSSSSTASSSSLKPSASSVSSAASAAAASATSSSGATAHSSSHRGNNHLGIIIGCVLGALALGLLLLVLLLCCRRRRRASRISSPRNRALSPDDHEVGTWREKQHTSDVLHKRDGSHNDPLAAGAGHVPLMSQHPAHRGQSGHENPFVPVPPPPRRSAQNSRAGLTDGIVPGDDPYLMDKTTGNPVITKEANHQNGSHKGSALAAGAGGAILGAAVMHHHNKKNDHEGLSEKNDSTLAHESRISRKPVPAGQTVVPPPSAFPTTTTNDDAFALNKTPRRRSGESGRRSLSRDATRANAAFDNEYSHPPGHEHHILTAAAVGAGALGGAALAHHHQRNHSASRSPHRCSLLAGKERLSDTSDSSGTSNSYSDAVPSQQPAVAANLTHPHDMPALTDIPPTPRTRSRRDSALGTAAPAAAAFAYQNRDRSRSISSEHGRRRQTPPAVPSRSPRRSSHFADVSFDHNNIGTPPLRYAHQDNDAFVHGHSGPGAREFSQHSSHHYPPVFAEPAVPISAEDKSIVGDNGYPHMNVPRRKSGGEYDHTKVGPLGPQTVVIPGSRFPAAAASSAETSDDSSTWRLSSGMPGGWQRDRNGGRTAETGRIASPLGRGVGDVRDRDSGISAMSGSSTVGGGGAARTRLRLSDLNNNGHLHDQPTPSQMMAQGRRSVEGEWVGNGGYDGYEYHHNQHHPQHGQDLPAYQPHHSVGTAM